MGLFATTSFDDVTVGDIADASGMTAAAVYYHFAGKEQILLEGCRAFTSELIECARDLVQQRSAPHDLIIELLAHVRSNKTMATVYFLGSSGLNPSLEAHRRLTRATLSELFADAARAARGKLSAAEAGAAGAALGSLLEVSASSLLSRDQAYNVLGADGFARSVRTLAGSVVGLPPRT